MNEITHISHSKMIFLWFLILAAAADFLSEFSELPSFIRIFACTFFSLCRRRCLLISHISAQDAESCQDEKSKPSPPVLSPCSLPISQLSTLRCGEAKQTAVQTPQIITQESHWERCVGSGCDSVCAPVFTDIHLHMSWPQPIRSHRCVSGFGLGAMHDVACGGCMLHMYYRAR